jgi:hypothetical protein
VIDVGAAQITQDDGLNVIFANTGRHSCKVVNPRAVTLSASNVPVQRASYSSAQQGTPITSLAPGQHAAVEIVAGEACAHPRSRAVAHYSNVAITIGATTFRFRE